MRAWWRTRVGRLKSRAAAAIQLNEPIQVNKIVNLLLLAGMVHFLFLHAGVFDAGKADRLKFVREVDFFLETSYNWIEEMLRQPVWPMQLLLLTEAGATISKYI